MSAAPVPSSSSGIIITPASPKRGGGGGPASPKVGMLKGISGGAAVEHITTHEMSPDGMARPVSSWKRQGLPLLKVFIVASILTALTVATLHESDKIFANWGAGADVIIGAAAGLTLFTVIVLAIRRWKKSENEKAANTSATILDTDATKPEAPKVPSKWRYPLYVLGAVGALIAISGIILGGYCAAAALDGARGAAALAQVKQAFIYFYQHTFQPLGEILGKYLNEFGHMAKEYLTTHGESLMFGGLYTLVGVPTLVYTIIKTKQFCRPVADRDTDIPEVGSGAGSRRNSIDETEEEDGDGANTNLDVPKPTEAEKAADSAANQRFSDATKRLRRDGKPAAKVVEISDEFVDRRHATLYHSSERDADRAALAASVGGDTPPAPPSNEAPSIRLTIDVKS